METTGAPPAASPATGAGTPVVSNGIPDADSAMIAINWEDVAVTVSIVGTTAQQPSRHYQVFPELDSSLPSRRDLRPIKLGKNLSGGKVQSGVAKGPAGGRGPGGKGVPLVGGGGPKKCHICGRGFNKMTYLKRHIQSHSSIKPYQCEICGWGE